ncbi:PepSY domain-containing protein [Mucilaginibacter sp. JRF]|uniref:PepSY-associated TM helix domain-containing protein n=1 Tax=Mucilaginibacter sp. JRF TaxID=2780088 RepID=UPI00188226BA|nr:PepSY-associated TM helix domain-containing protein [Mucilaginibacter sp. JRF]MBE9584277.1 PepSY domain-containing protein [Mucilaginibacter sp. JRF]
MALSAKSKTKKKRSLFYRVSAWLHLWLGLASGIVVVIVSLTGAALVFEQELRVWLQPYQTAESHGKEFIEPSKLKEAVMKRYNLPAISAVVYQGKDRSAVVPYYGDRSKFQLIYVDPYTAKILHYQLLDKDFYRIMLLGHYNLWLPREIGKPVVAYSTLIFVITLITGLVLWWPKKWTTNTRERAFFVKWSGNFKRVNHDLHNVLGFYSLAIALVLGLTGMVYGMKWFSDAVYWTASGGQKSERFARQQSDTTLVKVSNIPDEDILFKNLKAKGEDLNTQILTIGYPFGKAGAWSVSLIPELGRRMNERSQSYEQVSLKKLDKKPDNGGDKMMRLNYDLHVGSVGGIWTKIIALLVCLISGSLPITGFFIWWAKKQPKKQKEAKTKPTRQMVTAYRSV